MSWGERSGARCATSAMPRRAGRRLHPQSRRRRARVAMCPWPPKRSSAPLAAPGGAATERRSLVESSVSQARTGLDDEGGSALIAEARGGVADSGATLRAETGARTRHHGRLLAVHAATEVADALAKRSTDLGEAARTKDDQDDQENEQKMERLERSHAITLAAPAGHVGRKSASLRPAAASDRHALDRG